MVAILVPRGNDGRTPAGGITRRPSRRGDRHRWTARLLERLEDRSLLALTPIANPIAAYTGTTTNLTGQFPADGTSTSSITDGTETLSFSRPFVAQTVPNANWTDPWGQTGTNPPQVESATPRILTNTGVGATALTISLSQPAKQFGFEVAPASLTTQTFTATFMEGSTALGSPVTVSATTGGGARLVAAATDQAITSVVLSFPTAAGGLAIAQPRYALASSTLSLVKSVAQTQINPGGVLQYTLTVNNTSPSTGNDAVNAVVSDPLPANTTFLSAPNLPTGWTVLSSPPVGSNGTVTFTTPVLAHGTAATFTIDVTVAAATPAGTNINDTGSATSATTTGAVSSNTVTTVVGSSDISVVTTTSDSGPGTTLREAIAAANQNTGSTIDFAVAAAATAAVSGGAVTALTLLSAGGGYITAPAVMISGTGTGAVASAKLAGGFVTGFTISSAGSGYISAPTVTISSGAAPFVIEPISSQLPDITAPVTIDGTSQPGFAGAPVIQIDGASFGGTAGIQGLLLLAGAAGSTIDGLDITNFIQGDGIQDQASNVQIFGNYVGLTTTGSAAPNAAGIGVGGTGNTVGGTTAASRNVISGNDDDGIEVVGSSNLIEGNYVGTNATGTAVLANTALGVKVVPGTGNTIGGTTPGARNIISGNGQYGIFIGTGASNVVEGNYIGTDVTGAVAFGNGSGGVTIFRASDNTIGGATTAARNVISGNSDGGVNIQSDSVATTTDNLVEGNFIGTDFTGTQPLGNTDAGVNILDASSNTIGGTTAATGNVISANSDGGVTISTDGGQPTTGNLIVGNFIGTDDTGSGALGNTGAGVSMTDGVSGNTVGGAAAGSGNIIAFNTLAGVQVGFSAASTDADANNAILSNSIFANSKLGIDLGDDGVTLNTPGGPHTGPNLLQNFPVITSVAFSPNGTMIAGTLNSTPSTTFTIQLFASATADPSGFGQGQTYLGQTTVTTDGSGNGTFSATVAAVPGGQAVITTTATDPNGNTSEFSESPLIVTSTSDSGAGSLRQAIQSANARTGLQTILFDISSLTGQVVETIKPLTLLPAITTPVVIDGTTQPGFAGMPVIELSGINSAAFTYVLEIAAGGGGSTIRGLDINDAVDGDGIFINQANDNVVAGNFIGTDPSGTVAMADSNGVLIAGASGNTIGGTSAAARNVISGNQNDGVALDSGASHNVIEGNYIGTDDTGAIALGNSVAGVDIDGASNTVGGTAAGASNVIAGSVFGGVASARAPAWDRQPGAGELHWNQRGRGYRTGQRARCAGRRGRVG